MKTREEIESKMIELKVNIEDLIEQDLKYEIDVLGNEIDVLGYELAMLKWVLEPGTKEKHTSVRTLALEDITKETTILNIQERYVVTASDIDTKESSILNKELGVHKVNKG